jgi:hypothetical protein
MDHRFGNNVNARMSLFNVKLDKLESSIRRAARLAAYEGGCDEGLIELAQQQVNAARQDLRNYVNNLKLSKAKP